MDVSALLKDRDSEVWPNDPCRQCLEDVPPVAMREQDMLYPLMFCGEPSKRKCWKDTKFMVLSFYRYLFLFLEMFNDPTLQGHPLIIHLIYLQACPDEARDMAVDQYSCFLKTPSSREKTGFFRESFATPSPRPLVCSVRSGAIVSAAVMLANTVAAVHLRAVRSVKCEQSPSFALATCACRRCAEPCNKLPGLSPVFRGSFAKLAPK